MVKTLTIKDIINYTKILNNYYDGTIDKSKFITSDDLINNIDIYIGKEYRELKTLIEDFSLLVRRFNEEEYNEMDDDSTFDNWIETIKDDIL